MNMIRNLAAVVGLLMAGRPLSGQGALYPALRYADSIAVRVEAGGVSGVVDTLAIRLAAMQALRDAHLIVQDRGVAKGQGASLVVSVATQSVLDQAHHPVAIISVVLLRAVQVVGIDGMPVPTTVWISDINIGLTPEGGQLLPSLLGGLRASLVRFVSDYQASRRFTVRPPP